jgi:hypothetical protein
MLKKICLASISAILLMNGCGGSAESERSEVLQNLKNTNVPQPGKIDRANWEGVEELTDGFSITNDNTLLSFKLQSDNLDQMRTEVIFIDADNNPDTGYNSARWGMSLGAEYLVEGRNIYSYNGEGWSWSFISRIDRNNLNANELEVEFSRGIVDISDTFRATAALLDNNWRVFERYDSSSYTLQNGEVDDSISIGINDDGEVLTLNLSHNAIGSGEARSEAIFIDADNNPNTGYSNNRWGVILGAEYLIQNGRVYSYGGAGWSWNSIFRAQRVRNGDQISITFNRDALSLADNIRVNSYLLNNNWRPLYRYETLDHELFVYVPASNTRISHNLSSIIATIDSDLIDENTGVELFIDRDDNPATGENGIELRVQNGRILRLRRDGTWADIGAARIIHRNHRIIVSMLRHIVMVRKHIAIRANLLDANDQVIDRGLRTEYIVTGDDDEITLDTSDPDVLIFRVRPSTRLVPDLHEVTGGFITFDLDSNRNTGWEHNKVGSEAYINTWGSIQRFKTRENVRSWWDIWERGYNGEAQVTFDYDNGFIEYRVPRTSLAFPEDGIFTVSGTLDHGVRVNNETRNRHFYWTNKYEFRLDGSW